MIAIVRSFQNFFDSVGQLQFLYSLGVYDDERGVAAEDFDHLVLGGTSYSRVMGILLILRGLSSVNPQGRQLTVNFNLAMVSAALEKFSNFTVTFMGTSVGMLRGQR